MGLQIANTSPYIYLATTFFATSALSSDLLVIRFALTNGFLFLVLATMSGHSSNGSFSKDAMPLINGVIDIPISINACLFILNLSICIRLINDECPKRKLTKEEEALYRFFHCRCGLNRLQFDDILDSGHFLQLNANENLTHVESTLYLVLQGQVQCYAQFGNEVEHAFVKRSGQFFDIRLFNLLNLPIGFDSKIFRAQTITKTKLFGWNARGLIRMRNSHSPNLQPFWEYMVLGSLVGVAIRNHLDETTDTLYDSWLIPEDSEWLEGSPSRDFAKTVLTTGTWEHWKRELKQIKNSMMNIIPPKGIRHSFPSAALKNIPKHYEIEMVAKAELESEDLLNETKEMNELSLF